MIYQIAYDLNQPHQDYSNLISMIKTFDGWCPVQKSLWFVCHPGKASEVYNLLAPFLDRNDKLLVSAFTADHQGWLPKEVWNWINNHAHYLHTVR